MGLEYLYKDGVKACSDGPLPVKFDGVLIGEIRKVKDGFQYFADGDKKRGVIFSKVSEVQTNLALGQVPKKDQKALEVTKDATLENALKKAKADLKQSNMKLDTAKMLLAASRDLLDKQKEAAEEVLNLLNETVEYNDEECDGHTLLEDLTSCVENM